MITPIVIVLVALIVISILLTIVRNVVNRKEYAKTFLELTFPSDNTKSAFATEQLYVLLHSRSKSQRIKERLLGQKKVYSFELVSTKDSGIRYIVSVPQKEAEAFQRSMLSFLPDIKIREVEDYVSSEDQKVVRIAELKLSSDFVLPLLDQKALAEHDPMSYLTGHMTKLALNELTAFQLVLTPVLPSLHRRIIQRTHELKRRIGQGLPLSPLIQNRSAYMPNAIKVIFRSLAWLIDGAVRLVISLPSLIFDPTNKSIPILQSTVETHVKDSANPYEKELGEIIKSKLDQHLFEVSLRIYVVANTEQAAQYRTDELVAAFRPFASPQQSIVVRKNYLLSVRNQVRSFESRHLSVGLFIQNPILSSSELSDLYHFPHTKTTRTEDLIKSKSQELPAPLSLKNNHNLDVVFGVNNYGNSSSDVGLTDDDRSRHMYLIGQTGSGKSTVIYHMAKDDIRKGRGLAVIDPHGDLAEDLVATVPESRIDDLIYFNPFDIKHPIGVNLLELTPDLDEDELELEKELVCESVISIFRRVFNKDENTDAHRIEYILRNTIYTAFNVPDATIFTIYDLLNDPEVRKKTIRTLTDENLINFWKQEFGKAGGYQVVKMVSGVTAKVGRFLFSPTAKRILEQPKSTIKFDEVLDKSKILICNLAEGKLGEDTSQLLGTMIIAKIQQAAMRRARNERATRTPFYLFVDEFQNFATSSFTKLLSGGRKFGLRVTIAEQSTAQQSDRNTVNVILANTGTVVCFRTASPIDEELMLSQFSPLVQPGDIGNLPRYHFYMRLAAMEPTDAFSGETLPMNAPKDEAKIEKLVEASRSNYAIVYQKPAPKEVVPDAKPKAKKALTVAQEAVDTLP
ncbi:MAG TPA: type IV secretion system DNA-binding domain-containing protein [Patescibacteria group bacterium]